MPLASCQYTEDKTEDSQSYNTLNTLRGKRRKGFWGLVQLVHEEVCVFLLTQSVESIRGVGG